MNDLRQLNSRDPQAYNIETLATKFHISHDAVKRILKSKFKPDQDIALRQENKRYKAMGERQRAFRKHDNNNATTKGSRGGSSPQLP
ncbi:hypothetical protein K492DRAFT_173647, partial [Lichtheimia hyalospora FSU 10163]